MTDKKLACKCCDEGCTCGDCQKCSQNMGAGCAQGSCMRGSCCYGIWKRVLGLLALGLAFALGSAWGPHRGGRGNMQGCGMMRGDNFGERRGDDFGDKRGDREEKDRSITQGQIVDTTGTVAGTGN